MPALHRHVHVLRADLDRIHPPARRLAGDDLRAGAAERLVADLAGFGVLAHRNGKDVHRLRRGVIGLFAHLHRRQLPHRARVVVGDAGRRAVSDALTTLMAAYMLRWMMPSKQNDA